MTLGTSAYRSNVGHVARHCFGIVNMHYKATSEVPDLGVAHVPLQV